MPDLARWDGLRIALGIQPPCPEARVLVRILEALRSSHWQTDYARPNSSHVEQGCRKCLALQDVDLETLIKWVKAKGARDA